MALSRNSKIVSVLLITALLVATGLFAWRYRVSGLNQSYGTVTADHQAITSPAKVWVGSLKPVGPSRLLAVWANDGGDKVFQHETRAVSRRGGNVANSIWNGRKVSLFGARNEVVSFALILETGSTAASGLSVSFQQVQDTQGNKITGRPGSADDIFNFNGKDIELFHVGYLQILGLSKGLAYNTYDERHVPSKCQSPSGKRRPQWEERPCANRFVPDIAVPLILKTPFTIKPHSSQTIWVDLYIPEGTPAGKYKGRIEIAEKGRTAWEVPVELDVHGFTLPAIPSAKTMVAITTEDINARYLGKAYPDTSGKLFQQSRKIIDHHFQLAHRHKLSLVDTYIPPEAMTRDWLDRLDGSLFTPANGYDGPGIGRGNNVYAVGLYGSWPWKGKGRQAMWNATNEWVDWFRAHGVDKSTDFFLYLADESDNYRELETWAGWIKKNPGSGKRLASLATVDLPRALQQAPSLTIPAAAANIGITAVWEKSVREIKRDKDKKLYLYNGRRPATGSFALEDDGVSLRQLAWTQFKQRVDRWFYWNATYYDNVQCVPEGGGDTQTNVFVQARTFGCVDGFDPSTGASGFNYFNGDGVLMYPGTDRIFPEVSLGIDGPIASLRMKHWRRGIQDVDYLTLAMRADPGKTAAIVNRMIPKVLWEYGVGSRRDPSWVNADISWPVDADQWEAARRELAGIIDSVQ